MSNYRYGICYNTSENEMEVFMARDPVCGMEVETEKAKGRSVYGGVTVYFCSMNCKKRFDAAPASFQVKVAQLCPAPDKTTEAAGLSAEQSPEPSNDTSIDPVCRMTVVRSKAKGVSEHPLGEAIVREAEERKLRLKRAGSFSAVPGHGISAVVDGKEVLLGNLKLMKDRGVECGGLEKEAGRLSDEGKTPMFVALDKEPVGVIAVADTLKENSKEAVEAFKRLGLEVAIITGDNGRTASAIAGALGVDRVLSEVLPEDKAREIKKLQDGGKVVAMVGDGINDAPALAQANVGIAIGTGTDVAMEASDITLIGGDLRSIVTAVALSRATIRNIKQNLFLAFFYNIILIPVAAGVLYPFYGVLLNPMFAAAAMGLSSVTVVTNALRLKRFSHPMASS